jgi:hypothetical protein
MIITKDSHLDHGLTSEHLKLIFEQFGDRNEFFIETITIPAPLPLIPCLLFGPIMGDEKIDDLRVEWEKRGDRPYPSRILFGARPRLQSRLTVVCGPHQEHKCILYTAFGGPLAPKEVGDPTIATSPKDISASANFWAEHALAMP